MISIPPASFLFRFIFAMFAINSDLQCCLFNYRLRKPWEVLGKVPLVEHLTFRKRQCCICWLRSEGWGGTGLPQSWDCLSQFPALLPRPSRPEIRGVAETLCLEEARISRQLSVWCWRQSYQEGTQSVLQALSPGTWRDSRGHREGSGCPDLTALETQRVKLGIHLSVCYLTGSSCLSYRTCFSWKWVMPNSLLFIRSFLSESVCCCCCPQKVEGGRVV